MTKNQILDAPGMDRTLKRIAHEIIERNKTTDNLILVGIKTRGIYLANRLATKIEAFEQVTLPVEVLDISFYRDDLEKKYQDPNVAKVTFNQDLTDQRVVIVDDVLFTGRTVRAAMDAILEHARPANIQLAILVDRGHRELPIRADYVGKNIPTSLDERVSVQMKENDGIDDVTLIKPS